MLRPVGRRETGAGADPWTLRAEEKLLVAESRRMSTSELFRAFRRAVRHPPADAGEFFDELQQLTEQES